MGIGQSKLQAKTATGFAKPGGVARLTRREWIPTMGARPVTAIWGIGTRIAARLGDLGIHTVEQLARADHGALARAFGPTIGPSLRVYGLGGDDAPVVDEPVVAKGRSREETFTRDLADADEIGAQVARLAREVTESVVAEGRRVTHVSVKVRTATFFTRSKISKLAEPTADSEVVVHGALAVLERFELTPPGAPARRARRPRTTVRRGHLTLAAKASTSASAATSELPSCVLARATTTRSSVGTMVID